MDNINLCHFFYSIIYLGYNMLSQQLLIDLLIIGYRKTR